MKVFNIYTDGSWRPSTPNRIGAGIVVVEDNEIVEEFMLYRDNSEMAEQRQICGELIAAMEGVRIAIQRGYDKVVINFDYNGVSCWATSQWKAKNKYTQMYKDYMEQMNKKIEIEFIKVKAHNKNVFNDYVDYLAKKALELKEVDSD